MGSCLSPLLAEIFMNYFETTFLKINKYKNELLHWFRYVDDILICWNGSNRQFEDFFNQLNNFHPNIKFTVEKEENKTINYLDLSINRSDHEHNFKIYRKPSFTDVTIHRDSSHPTAHKLSAYHSMLHRLINIPLRKEDFEIELSTIKQIALANGYTSDLIDRMLTKKLKIAALKLAYSQINVNTKTYAVLPYYHKISHFIKNTIKNFDKNLQVSYKNTFSLKRLLGNSKDEVAKIKQSGVYELFCECGASYVGQSGRATETRVNEHKKAYTNTQSSIHSTFAKHLVDNGHTSSFTPRVLHFQNKGLKLDLLEAAAIKSRAADTNKCLNEIQDAYNSPLVGLKFSTKH